MLRHLLIRLLLILLGYGLATVASGVAVGLVFAVAEASDVNEIAGLIAIAIMLIGIYAALPAPAAVASGEAGFRREIARSLTASNFCSNNNW